MRIVDVRTFPIALPFAEPYVSARGTLRERVMVILRVESTGGLMGYGDAVPLSLRGGPALGEVQADLEGPCREILMGAGLDSSGPAAETAAIIRPLLAACAESGASPGALCAVDLALLDLIARVFEVPAWTALGASAVGAVECNGTLGAGEPDDVAERAAELCDRGYGTLKVKVGAGEDGERMRAVRSACGEEVRLRIDANGAWSVDVAAAELGGLDDVGLELAEQPCATLAEMATLRKLVEVPLVADESVSNAEEATCATELGACDAVTLKLAKVGGPHAALRIAASAPCYLSSALDSPLGVAAALHTVQAMPDTGFAGGLAHGLSTTGLFADNIASTDALDGPLLSPPGSPGLGVEVDEGALERLRLR